MLLSSFEELENEDNREQTVRGLITRNTDSAPTNPRVYRMPCGNCYVDFFLASDGTELWLVPGDERSYTRDTIATLRRGDYPWERMYTLAHAAAENRRRATFSACCPSRPRRRPPTASGGRSAGTPGAMPPKAGSIAGGSPSQ